MPNRSEFNQQKKITLSDVASASGVSISTVSFVLSGRNDMRISAHTEKTVLKVADELGYRRRNAGRPLEKAIIGLMIDNITVGDYSPYSIEGIEEVARQNDVLVEIVVTGDDKEYQSTFLRKWKADRVLGAIYLANQPRIVEPPEALSELKAVLVNCFDAEGRFQSFMPNSEAGGYTATKMLIDQGCRRIACLGPSGKAPGWHGRRTGYVNAINERSSVGEPLIFDVIDALPDGARTAAHQLMGEPNPPDGFFCCDDLAAIGVYKAMRERGIGIGASMPVIGFGNLEFGLYLHPPLTTVNQPNYRMGALSIEWLLNSRKTEPRQVLVDCPIVIRSSH